MYCDHANIASLFKPDAIEPNLSRSALDKVHRWLHTLAHFHITHMEHLKGQHNLWADLLKDIMRNKYHPEFQTPNSNDQS